MAIDKMAILTDGYAPHPACPTAAEIADAVYDELKAGHTIDGSYGLEISKLTKKVDRNFVVKL